MRRTLSTMLILTVFAGSSMLAQADDQTAGAKEAQLGLAVEPVPPALYSQLSGVLPKGQGVLVGHIVKDSPAAKAGLELNDILLTYGDQKLYLPEQLMKLVGADKPGHEVAVGFVRSGKVMACKVLLGEAEPAVVPEETRVYRLLPNKRLAKLIEELEARRNETAWESLDLMQIARLEGKAGDFDIQLHDNRLVLRASRKKEIKDKEGKLQEQYECYESMTLPSAIDKDKIDARYHNGVLTVTIPKTAAAKAQRIAVKAN